MAGDAVGFEAWPANPSWRKLPQELFPTISHFTDHLLGLHDWLLALLGIPIGELWNLEQLAEECAKRRKWTFFSTSAPLNVPGGVASPPNALAIL